MLAYSVPPGYRRQTPPRRHQRYFRRAIAPRSAGLWLRPSLLGGFFLLLALPRGTAQSLAPAESHRRRQAGKLAGSLIPPRRVARQVILPSHAILGTCSAVTPRPNKHGERIEMRTPRLFLGVFALALILPLLLLACSGSDELADGPSSEPTTTKEEGVFRIFKQGEFPGFSSSPSHYSIQA